MKKLAARFFYPIFTRMAEENNKAWIRYVRMKLFKHIC